MRGKIILVISVISLLAAGYFWWFNPAKVLERQTNKLVSSLNIAADDGQVVRGYQSQKFSSLLDDNILILIPYYEANNDYDRDKLVTSQQAFSYGVKSCQLEYQILSVEFHNEEEASVNAEFSAEVVRKNGKSQTEAFAAELKWTKRGSSWKLSSVRWQR